MIAKYDEFDRLEQPLLIATNPEGSPYGVIDSNYIKDFSFTPKFNDVSEISLKVYEFEGDVYKHLYPQMRIDVQDYGSWIIQSAEETKSVSDGVYKNLTLKSTEQELANVSIPYIDGTFKFYDYINPEKTLLGMLMEKMPQWTIEHIDGNIISLYRTFEVPTNYLLDFMLNEVQEAYGCFFVFNGANKTIAVYDQNTYVHYTDVILTWDELMNQTEITRDAESIVTALVIKGKDDLTVNAVNPIGTSIIYNFSYVKPWMSEELRNKINSWETDVKNAEPRIIELNTQLGNENTKLVSYNSELTSANILLKGLKAERDKLLTVSGADLSTINSEINDAQNQVNACQSKVDNQDALIKRLTEERNTFQNTLKPSEYFGELYYSFLAYVYEAEYNQDNIGVTDTMDYNERMEVITNLYNDAKDALEQKVATPETYTIDAKSFIFDKRFLQYTEQLQLGHLVGVKTDPHDDSAIEYFPILEMDINFEEHSNSITIGNKFNSNRASDLFAELIQNTNAVSRTVEYITSKKANAQEVSDIQKTINSALDLSKNSILSANGQNVEINDTGYHGRMINEDGTLAGEEVALINNTLAFTRDNWDTCSLALGKIRIGDAYVYGIAADVIVGKFIIGENLNISNNSGTYTIDDEGIIAHNSETNCTVKITPSNENEMFAIYKGDITGDNRQFFVDASGNVSIKGHIEGTSGTFSGELKAATGVFSGLLSGGTINIADNFTVNEEGIVKVSKYLHFNQNGYIASENGQIQLWATHPEKGNGFAYFGGNVECKGVITCTNLKATGGSITGGTIGGLQINNSNIASSNGNIQLKDDGSAYFGGTLECTNIKATGGSINGGTIGGFTINSTNISSSNGQLQLKSGGEIYCSGKLECANIQATGGTIAGWTINGLALESHIGRNTVRLWPHMLEFTGGTTGNHNCTWYNVIKAGQAASDIRLKTDINDFNDKHNEFFDNLKCHEFRYLPGHGYDDTIIHFGLVAQETLEDIKVSNLPGDYAIVYTNPETNYYNMDKQELIALCIWQIQKLKNRVTELEYNRSME